MVAADQSIANTGIELMSDQSFIINSDDRILVTGAAGFIGSRVLQNLLERGFRNLVCFARPCSKLARIQAASMSRPAGARIEVLEGNLLSPHDCDTACKDVAVICARRVSRGRGLHAMWSW